MINLAQPLAWWARLALEIQGGVSAATLEMRE
jgi:hypothetical protein